MTWQITRHSKTKSTERKTKRRNHTDRIMRMIVHRWIAIAHPIVLPPPRALLPDQMAHLPIQTKQAGGTNGDILEKAPNAIHAAGRIHPHVRKNDTAAKSQDERDGLIATSKNSTQTFLQWMIIWKVMKVGLTNSKNLGRGDMHERPERWKGKGRCSCHQVLNLPEKLALCTVVTREDTRISLILH